MNDMSKDEKSAFNELIIGITNTNTQAIKLAKNEMNYESMDQINQASSTLYSILVGWTF